MLFVHQAQSSPIQLVVPRPEVRRSCDRSKLTRLTTDVTIITLATGQRVALARVLAKDRAIWLMDEPFGALDGQTRSLMQEPLLEIWQQSHKTLLFITRDIDAPILLGDVSTS
jgi:ABC-type nitrate/sulfonate/bicarbonate transport system ATPase subunit